MVYTAEINRSNPGCFLFLIDQSSSMADVYGGGLGNRQKAEEVANSVNRLLLNLIIKCTRSGVVMDYFEIGIIGYGEQIGSIFSGNLSGRSLVPISEIASNPFRYKKTGKEEKDSNISQIVEIENKMPEWIVPVANGGTPMRGAFEYANPILADWVRRHPKSFPPIIINITDGESTDGEPTVSAQELMNLSTQDGNTLIFNWHISSQDDATILFPNNDEWLPNEFASMLFKMSSVLPKTFYKEIQADGFQAEEQARGFAFNSDLVNLRAFLDISIGTRAITASDQDTTNRQENLGTEIGKHEWPALLSEIEEQIESTRNIVDTYGKDYDRHDFYTLESQIRAAILSHEANSVHQKKEQLESLRIKILSEQHDFWVGYFKFLITQLPQISEKAYAEHLVSQGYHAIETNNIGELKIVVRHLDALLPVLGTQSEKGNYVGINIAEEAKLIGPEVIKRNSIIHYVNEGQQKLKNDEIKAIAIFNKAHASMIELKQHVSNIEDELKSSEGKLSLKRLSYRIEQDLQQIGDIIENAKTMLVNRHMQEFNQIMESIATMQRGKITDDDVAELNSKLKLLKEHVTSDRDKLGKVEATQLLEKLNDQIDKVLVLFRDYGTSALNMVLIIAPGLRNNLDVQYLDNGGVLWFNKTDTSRRVK